MAVSLINWKVSTEYNGSDHNTIYFDLCVQRIKEDKVFQFHKTDWKLFGEILDNHPIRIPAEITESRLDKCVDKFYKSLNIALEKACPKTVPRTKDKNNPWWTKQLRENRRNLNKLYRRRNNSDEDRSKYKEAEKIYRKQCQKAKSKDWKYLVEAQNTNESINKLRKIY